jgi:hypothetical protein
VNAAQLARLPPRGHFPCNAKGLEMNYYFNVRTRSGMVYDKHGLAFDDWDEALDFALNLLPEAVLRGGRNITICDENGTVVDVISAQSAIASQRATA